MTGRTIAADGVTIGWLTVGDGPGIVIVHGAMQSAHSQLHLARLLAPSHTVHLLDRRGRGRSGPYASAADHTAREVSDLAAVLTATGARQVVGISSGALIALRAALAVPTIERVAAFEPPLLLDDPGRLAQIDRFRREIAEGNLVDAMVTGMIAAEMGPPIMLRLPRAVLRAGARRMLAASAKPGPGTPRPGSAQPGSPHPGSPSPEPSVRELAGALSADFEVVAENAGRLGDFAAIRQSTLLLDGTRTRPYLRHAVEALARTVPGSRRVSLDGTNHAATQNRDQYGHPERVAPALLDFFA